MNREIKQSNKGRIDIILHLGTTGFDGGWGGMELRWAQIYQNQSTKWSTEVALKVVQPASPYTDGHKRKLSGGVQAINNAGDVAGTFSQLNNA
jgi:hypothetical protein